MTTPATPPVKVPPTVTQDPLPLAARLQVYLSAHRFYSYKDILADVFTSDEDAFVDAWVSQAFPPAVELAIVETMHARVMELLLLRRLVRLQGEILAALK